MNEFFSPIIDSADRRAHFLHCLSASPDQPKELDSPEGDEAEADDLDEELEETGAIANRSSGKTGTDTSAEPERKPT